LRKEKLFTGILAVTLALATPAWSESSVNGNLLLRSCSVNADTTSGNEIMRAYTCLGYVLAVVDFLASGNSGRFKACLPANADMNQVMDIVKNFLRDHPEKRHLIALRWSRFTGQFGGKAKMDSGFDYAASFSPLSCLA
jgi:hypothetical protein